MIFHSRSLLSKPAQLWAAIIGGIVGAMPGIFLLIMAALSRNDPGDFIGEREGYLLLAIPTLAVATSWGAYAGVRVAGQLRRSIKHRVWTPTLGGMIGGIIGIVLGIVVVAIGFMMLVGY